MNVQDASTLAGRSRRRAPQEFVNRTIEEYIDRRLRLVDEGISQFLKGHYEGDILDIVGYVSHGGKRLRGILAILVCEALGGNPRDAMAAAVAVELAHAASLTHDDIIDGDVMRRGRAALHMRYDIPTAILIPHLIVPHAVLSTQIYGPKATGVILDGWARVVRGQVRDYLPANRGAVRPKGLEQLTEGGAREYFGIIRDKTAALFETAAILGALAAQDDRDVAIARLYAWRLGLAFKIADDVTDLEAHCNESWSTVLDASATCRSILAIAGMIAAEGEDVITPRAIARARDLATLNVRRSEGYARMFPLSRMKTLLRIFPAFAVDQIYAEARNYARQSQDQKQSI